VEETRAIQVLPAPWDLPFPHARQALLIERHTRDPRRNRPSDGAVPGITTTAQPRHRHLANPRLEDHRMPAPGRQWPRRRRCPARSRTLRTPIPWPGLHRAASGDRPALGRP
jgi:hypothetical protein